jgi:LacI family transcriptional regulator
MPTKRKSDRRPTIVDVARLADVSLGTVSAVLNRSSTVRPRLRERVEHAMRALDYHPNQIARSLKMQCTHTIGMVVPDIANPFFTSVIRGAEMEGQQRGYSIILCDTNEDPLQERHQLSTLFSRRVDGVLISSSNHDAARDRLTRRRFPIVFFDRIPRGYEGDAVLTDNLAAAYRAVRFLIHLGHRRIAVISGALEFSIMADRVDGYRKAMQEAGLPIPTSYLQQGDFKLEGGHRCGLELMRLPDPPTAIFSCNNLMTLGLMGALVELNIACPDQVSVLGFDDFDWAASFNPRLTTMAQQMLEMGKSAMEMLVHRIESPIAEAESEQGRIVVLEAELRVRDSTAPAPADPKFPISNSDKELLSSRR